MKQLTIIPLFSLLIIINGCLGIPAGVSPVTDFTIERYMGKWYEIARLEHSFEQGLTKVTAEYSLNDDGSVAVINRGYSEEDNEWKEAQGKAYFVHEEHVGYLKVSFFWPFYGSYIIFGLDKENYNYAYVCGPNLSYLWLLAREPSIEAGIIESFINQAQSIGFDTSTLIMVEQ
ncbi:MAG: lipocalin family protein [bacterium]